MQKILTILSITCSLGLFAQTNLAPVGAVWHYKYDYSNTDIISETFNNYVGYLKITAISQESKLGKQCLKIQKELYYRSNISDVIQYNDKGYEWYRESNDTIYKLIDNTSFAGVFIYNSSISGSDIFHKVDCKFNSTDLSTNAGINATFNGVGIKAILQKVETNFMFPKIVIDTIYQFIGPKNSYFDYLPYFDQCILEGPAEFYSLRCYQDSNLGLVTFSGAACDYVPILTSLNEVSYEKYIQIYPNPSDGIIYIESSQNISIQIFTITGKEIYYSIEKKNKHRIKDLAQGIYFVKVGESIKKLIVN